MHCLRIIVQVQERLHSLDMLALRGGRRPSETASPRTMMAQPEQQVCLSIGCTVRCSCLDNEDWGLVPHNACVQP